MRCKRDHQARSGRSRWSGGACDVVRELERSAQPLPKEVLIARLGGDLWARNSLRAAVTAGLVEVMPDGRYRSAEVRPTHYEPWGRKGSGPRIAPAHSRHVRRHRPGRPT